jgi:hypothetical protein
LIEIGEMVSGGEDDEGARNVDSLKGCAAEMKGSSESLFALC